MSTKRIVVEDTSRLPIFYDGTGIFNIIDSTDGKMICQHRFPLPTQNGPIDKPEWYQAQKKIAQAIADAINAAPNAAVEYIRSCHREADHIWETAAKDIS